MYIILNSHAFSVAPILGTPEGDKMRFPVKSTISLALAALAVSGCSGSSSSSSGSSGSQGSSTVSIKDIVAGHGNACDVVSKAQIAAAIGPIIRTRHLQSNADCSWDSAQFNATIAFQTPGYWPTALTDTYSNPLTPSPCPGDANGVYGTSSYQYTTGAFCSTGDYEVQVVIGPTANVGGNNGPAQIKAVGTITAGILAHNP
jgi:hypothetical protein